MEENYYKERDISSKLPIILLIIVGIILLIIISFFIFKSINKKDTFNIEEDFISISKNYYNKNSAELPQEVYECTEVTLEKLLAKDLIKDVDNYSTCNKYDTKLKVCKVASSKYQYTPILVCDSITTSFDDWQDGTISNLIPDNSDVEFSFLGYKKIEKESTEPIQKWEDEITVKDYNVISKTTYYRYRDKEWQWQEKTIEYFTNNDVGSIVAYYAESPNSKYTNSDSQTTAYKWYINETVVTQPTEMYTCKRPGASATANKLKPCSESTDGKTETVKEFYTCGTKTTEGRLVEVEEGSSCDCSSEKYGTNCAVKKSYYPSTSDNPNKEKVYYAEAPVSGALKDVSTKLNASRYYKEVITITDKYYQNSPSSTAVKVGDGKYGAWTEYKTIKPKEYNTREIETRVKVEYELKDTSEDDWKKISTDYLSLNELITKFKELKYDVNSLQSINNNTNLKYEVKLKYRNKNN